MVQMRLARAVIAGLLRLLLITLQITQQCERFSIAAVSDSADGFTNVRWSPRVAIGVRFCC